MPRLAIIADDLTGALDAAAPFAAVPGGAVVASRPEALDAALAADAGVVAVSTRSRETEPGLAREAVARVLAALPEGVRLFKKVDSRMKGNVAAELSALARGPLLAAPAIPEFGRVVRNGAVEGFGLERPVMVRAALGPFAESAWVPDAASPDDLLAALRAAEEGTVLLGSRGLAAALAALWRLDPPPARAAGGLDRPLLIAVGSTDPITREQVARLMAGAMGADIPLAHITAPAGRVPLVGGTLPAAVVVVEAAASATEASGPAEVAARLAAGVVALLASARAMLFTGGATAEAIFDAMGESVFGVTGEALPGMPLLAVAQRQAVTKSGGFGEPDCLLRLAGAPAVALS